MTSASPPVPARSSNHAIREEWLGRWQEDIIEPELPIVDPYHHLFYRLDLEGDR
jgi:hypothetical protein